MAEIDTSSYPKATLPVQKSMLEQAGQMQQLESNRLTIDRQKLENTDKALGFMTRAMGSLGPEATKDQYAAVAQNAVKMGLVPPNMLNNYIERLNAAPDGKTFYKEFMTAAATHEQQIKFHLGQTETQTDQSTVYQGVRKPAIEGGGFVPSTQMPLQVPPTQEVLAPDNSRRLVGPSGPAGVTNSKPSLPVAAPTPAPIVKPVPTPTPAPAVTGATAPTINNGSEFNNRFNASYATGAAPGVAEAQQAVGSQSGKDYAVDLNRAKNYQADVYPAMRVLDILKAEGPTAFGVGTDNLNTLKNAIVTWFPNVDPNTIKSVANFEEAKKQLVALARSAGNTGTNDQLAAAFEANPNTKMTGATIESVLKSVVALRKMQHAQTLLFGQQNLSPDQYSQWIAKNQNVLDPRAFGFDIMSNEAKTKMLGEMATQDKSGNWVAKKGKEKEFRKFETSLGFANDAGLIEPPGRK